MKSKAISVLLALVMLTVATGVFAQQEKVTICHKPGTEDEETLSVAAPALNAHLGHGDNEGECVPNPPAGCYDTQFLDFQDIYYDGVPNTPGNVIYYNSIDGSCSGGIAFDTFALVNVANPQDVSPLCISLGLSSGIFFVANFYNVPSTTYICH